MSAWRKSNCMLHAYCSTIYHKQDLLFTQIPIKAGWIKVVQYISPEVYYSVIKKECNLVSFETICESEIYKK